MTRVTKLAFLTSLLLLATITVKAASISRVQARDEGDDDDWDDNYDDGEDDGEDSLDHWEGHKKHWNNDWKKNDWDHDWKKKHWNNDWKKDDWWKKKDHRPKHWQGNHAGDHDWKKNEHEWWKKQDHKKDWEKKEWEKKEWERKEWERKEAEKKKKWENEHKHDWQKKKDDAHKKWDDKKHDWEKKKDWHKKDSWSASHHKAETYHVQVGPHGKLVYDPPYVHAKPGDTVRFTFNPKNHTVTQSSFENPCQGIDGGFKTGFIPVAPDTHPLPYRDFVIPDTHGKPLWFYCGQVNHCQSGMVFAINPPAHGNTFHEFKGKAKASGKWEEKKDWAKKKWDEKKDWAKDKWDEKKEWAKDKWDDKKKHWGGNSNDLDDYDDDATLSQNLELDASSSTSSDQLKTYAVAGIALLSLNAILAIAAVAVGVLIYVKKNASPKVSTLGSGRYAPVFEADKSSS